MIRALPRDAAMERTVFKPAKSTARPSGSVHTELSTAEKFQYNYPFFGELSIRKSLGMSGCALCPLSLHHLF